MHRLKIKRDKKLPVEIADKFSLSAPDADLTELSSKKWFQPKKPTSRVGLSCQTRKASIISPTVTSFMSSSNERTASVEMSLNGRNLKNDVIRDKTDF